MKNNHVGVKKGTKRGPYKRSQRKKEVNNLTDLGDGMSYEEIAQIMKITPTEVRVIEREAMKKLRKPSDNNRTLHSYYDIQLSDAEKNLGL